MFNVALLIISASHKNSEQQFSTALKLIVKESLVKVILAIFLSNLNRSSSVLELSHSDIFIALSIYPFFHFRL